MRQRVGRWTRMMLAGTVLALLAPQAHASMLYLGLPSGKTFAYATSTAGTGWVRASNADLPGVYYDALAALADLDGDGDADALVGDRNGVLSAFRNDGSNAAPAWARVTAWEPAFDFGSGAAPALGDLDGDGDRDLLVGRPEGDVVAFENTGNRQTPAWTERPAWRIADLGYDSRPALGDVDGDRRLELLVGTRNGGVFAFSASGGGFTRRADLDPPRVGERVAPGLGDFDGDGRADLFLGDGYAQVFPFRSVDGGWMAAPGWTPPDPGSGPAGVALVGKGNATPPDDGGGNPPDDGGGNPPDDGGGNPPDDGGPLARLSATPLRGNPPLHVRFDASRSRSATVFTWDFGDGAIGRTAVAPADPAAAIVAGRTAYQKARATREAGHYTEAVPLDLAAAGILVPLTTVAVPGPVEKNGTTRIDRVAHWYLGAIAHELAGIYLWHDVGLAGCDRYATALNYAHESATQMVEGGWPNAPAVNGTNEKIAKATQKLRDRGCAIPAPVRMFAGATPTAGPTTEHDYTATGTYVARVTVSDGTRTSSATVTIAVGDVAPPPPPPPPPPPGGGDGDFEGFGADTPGGRNGREVHVTEATDAAVRAALKSITGGHATVIFDVAGPIDITSPLPQVTGSFITIDGRGVTLVGTAIYRTAAMLDIRGHDVIVKNMRLRNGGDNLRAQGDGAYNIVFSHISSTGAGDDGISIGYGAHDVTVQDCFLAGNTRSIFMKYGATTDVSIHHTWIMKQWIRGPLVSGNIMADLRNLIVEDWSMWGSRFESTASGNVVNSLWILGAYARSIGGKANSALELASTSPVFTAGNVYRGQADRGPEGTASAPLPAPPVTTLPVAEMEGVVRARAGCMPRDRVDQAYIDRQDGWRVSKYEPFRITP